MQNSHYQRYLTVEHIKRVIECIALGHQPCTEDEGNWCLRCASLGVRKTKVTNSQTTSDRNCLT